MPIATDEEKSYEWLKTHTSNHNANYRCGVCGGRLQLIWAGSKGINHYVLACVLDFNHDKLERDFELSPANTPGFTLFDAGKKRRKKLEKEIGTVKTTALAKFEGVTNLTKQDAMLILDTIWPKAPAEEKTRAALLCFSYQLNPLMSHVFLVPFRRYNKETKESSTTWATIMGINAKRLLASRRGAFSYTDDTPRIMNKAEQEKILGQVYDDRLYAIVKLKDPKTSAEAVGYGWWPKADKVYGEEKGNTQLNMAIIRAESQALSRLRPGEMPQNVEVMDEAVAREAAAKGYDVESTAVEVEEPEPTPPIDAEIPEEEPAAGQVEPPQDAPKAAAEAAKPADNPGRKITQEEFKALTNKAKQAGVTLTSKYLKEKGIQIAKFSDMTLKDYNSIMLDIKKILGEK